MNLPPPRITIGLATCGRPDGIASALAGLANQAVPDALRGQVRVAVVDNHARTQGRRVVEQLASGFPFPLHCEVEPEPGISFARNRLVKMAAGSEYLAFFDDDERPEPQWLAELVRVAEKTRCSAVLGPVLATVEGRWANWMSPLYQRPRHRDGSTVTASDFRTSNVLLKMSDLDSISGPFHPAFALIGGSDTVLGMQLQAAGKRFAWADRAIVSETMPAERVHPRWYLRRRFRSGFVFSSAVRAIDGNSRALGRGLYRGTGTLASAPLRLLTERPRQTLTALRSAGDIAYGLGCIRAALGGSTKGEYSGRSTD